MTTRGKTIKRATPTRLSLLRPMITRRQELTHEVAKCCGCGTCAKVCPTQAITLAPAELADGRVVEKPRVDIAEKCCFCGECVVLCPTHALAMTINGEAKIPVIEGKAFPLLVRTMTLDVAACQASTDTAYVDNCPVHAISALVLADASGRVTAVQEVKVDKRACLNCTRCMETGPRGGFTVVKPYKGRTRLNTALCPAGCQACADICPTHAITYDGQAVALDERFCLYCGACEAVCPAPGAVRIVRTGFVHTPVESGAWVAAMDKLVSYQEAARELDIKSQQRRRQAVLDLLLPQEAAQEK